MRLYFKSVVAEKATNDWPMGHYGCSGIDNKDYAVSTHYLKGDEVPGAMNDAKTSSEMIAGLLNAFYMKKDVSSLSEEEVMRMGRYVEEEDVPPKNPNQGELNF